MEIVNPNEIGAKISTLIADSKEKFCAVTAFVDLSRWTKILVNLEKAKKRGVIIKFYFREIKELDFKTLKDLGVELYKIKGLHTKLYFNENEVIVSSMNFYEFSDLHSIDIALHYKDIENYNKIYDYFQKYIHIKRENSTYLSDGYKNEMQDLYEYLSDRFKDFTINLSSTYLFSKSLVPFFHIFITQNQIKLKLPSKNPSIENINDLTKRLEEIIKHELILNKPDESYNYYTWDINLKEPTTLELVNIISNVQGLNLNS